MSFLVSSCHCSHDLDGDAIRHKKLRRRGKTIVKKARISTTNEHNEYGLVEPERPQPFRSPSSDVMCTADRCNDDFRIMARGFPESDDIEKLVKCDDGSLARCFPDIPFKDVSKHFVRRMAYSVVALHVASHNCDTNASRWSNCRTWSLSMPPEFRDCKKKRRRHRQRERNL